MSLLNSVLGSIGTGNRTPLPKQPDRASTATPPAAKSTSQSKIPSNTASTKPPAQHVQPTTLKRKFEADTTQHNGTDRPPPKTNYLPEGAKSAGSQPSTSMSAKQETPSRTPTPAAAPSKPPPKGSYMDLMNQAKALQAEKAAAAQSVGMIKHAAAKKEHLSKTERRRKEEDLRLQGKGKVKVGRVGENGAIKKPTQNINGRSKELGGSAYKGTSRMGSSGTHSKDKVARPKEREESTYKGTAGLGKAPSSQKYGSKPPSTKPGRHLEEDGYDTEDSFVVDDDEEGPSAPSRHSQGRRYRYIDEDESDASSDMEAGYDDVELEERRAALQAKKDDEREKALEERLKREKEARKQAFARGP